MTALMPVLTRDTALSGPRARWLMAFAVVALAHVLLMLWLSGAATEVRLQASSGSPVLVDMVMPAASPAAARPVPAAPEPVPEKPAPEQVAPEPEPEPADDDAVAPEPEPTPEPAAREAPDTDTSANDTPASAAAPGIADARAREQQLNWQTRLLMHLEREKRYPLAARQRDEQGVAQVQLTMDRGGRVLSASLSRSSGSRWLDEEALALMRRAQPLPAPPDSLPGERLSLKIPIRFSLR